MQCSASTTTAGLESPPQDFDQAMRRRSSQFQGVSSTLPPRRPPLLEEIPAVEIIPICQFFADFCASIHLRMQSIFSSPSNAILCLDLEGLTSTVLIVLVGLEKTLQQPLYSPEGTQSPPLNAAPPEVSSPSEKTASQTLGPNTVPPHAYRAQHFTGGLSPIPIEPPIIGSNERVVTCRVPHQMTDEAEEWVETRCNPFDSSGQLWPSAPQWHPVQP